MRASWRSSVRDCKQLGTNPFLTPFNVFVPLTRCLIFGVHSIHSNLSPRAARLYLMRLDDLWASLFVASSPPAPGLTTVSLYCGREFATRFFRLRLAATPRVSLRLPSSVPIGSFHPIRFCPCWAHDMRLSAASVLCGENAADSR